MPTITVELLPSKDERFQKIASQIGGTPPLDVNANGLFLLEDGHPQACLTFERKGERALIGNYEALSRGAGVTLLQHAIIELRKRGVRRAVGPIQGSTWHRYRLALPKEHEEPYFVGEPNNPSDYPNHFIAAGFQIGERYESRIVTDLCKREAFYEKMRMRMEKRGMTFRSFDPCLMEEIYRMCLLAFQENLFYEPISFEAFAGLYGPLLTRVDHGFVQLAYGPEGDVAGFVLAFPDLVDPSRLIFKTLAAASTYRSIGLGVFLYDRTHKLAAEKGFRSVIHALMHEKHNSLKLSLAMDSQPFREYALFDWNEAP